MDNRYKKEFRYWRVFKKFLNIIEVDIDFFTLLLILIDKNFQKILNFSDDIILGIQLNPNLSIRLYELSLTKKNEINNVEKKIKYLGGIHVNEIESFTKINSKDIKLLFPQIGFKEIDKDWFSLEVFEQPPIRKYAIVNVIEKVLFIKKPINLLQVQGALIRHASRNNYDQINIPKETLKYSIIKNGFICDNEDNVTFLGPINKNISEYEELIINHIENTGSVLLHNEISNIIIENGSTQPNASKLLSQSPIIIKMDRDLYTIVGKEPTGEEIEKAFNRKERIDSLPEIIIKESIIIYRFTISSASINTGSVYCGKLPNLGDSWIIKNEEKEFGNANMNALSIWGFKSVFKYLNISSKDRIEFYFDKNNKIIEVKRIGSKFNQYIQKNEEFVLSHDELIEKINKQNAIGKQGEIFINEYFEGLKNKNIIEDYEWRAKINSISPYDFVYLDKNCNLIYVDVKSTENNFENNIHISYNELIKMKEEINYSIYRIFNINNNEACLVIITNLEKFSKSINDIILDLPNYVLPDSFSINPKIFKSKSEVIKLFKK